jgi:hypothetical protein
MSEYIDTKSILIPDKLPQDTFRLFQQKATSPIFVEALPLHLSHILARKQRWRRKIGDRGRRDLEQVDMHWIRVACPSMGETREKWRIAFSHCRCKSTARS